MAHLGLWLKAKVYECGLGLWLRLNAGPVCDSAAETAYAACATI